MHFCFDDCDDATVTEGITSIARKTTHIYIYITSSVLLIEQQNNSQRTSHFGAKLSRWSIPDTPWDCHICRSVGVAWGVNVGIYGIHGVSGNELMHPKHMNLWHTLCGIKGQCRHRDGANIVPDHLNL